MKTTVEDITSVKKKVTVEIEAEEIEKRVNESYKSLAKRARLPGFRPGKAPRKILEKYYGPQLLEDLSRDLVAETLPTAVEETKTIPVATPAIEKETLKTGESFKYFAIMEVRPTFELQDYKGIEVEKEIVSVTDEDVGKQVEEIRRNSGNLTSVEEDRPVREDDYVLLDYEGFQGEKPLDDIKGENFLLREGSGDFHPDFEKSLIGQKKGDNANITVAFEENYRHAKLAGKTVDFKVKVKDIKVLELPELDDDFAKSLGGEFESLEQLKAKIQEEMIAREEKRAESEMKGRLLAKISESVDFELPESLVESETNFAIENVKRSLMRSGSDLEKAGITEDRMRDDFRPASEKRVKDMLILGEVAKQNELDISEEELSEGFKEMALNMGQDPQVVRSYYEASQALDAFRDRLLEEKTLNYLVEGASIKAVTADVLRPEDSEK